MKKKSYYVLPFIVIPALMLLFELLDNIELLKMNPYITGAFLLLFSALFGFLSPSDRSVDYVIAIVMPLSLFCFMFVGGFLSTSDLETRFHLYKAVDTSFQPIALFLYVAMTIIAFVASFKFFRNLKTSAAN